MKVSCCYGCTPETGRSADCHSTCQKYKDERAELDRINDEKRKENDIRDYIAGDQTKRKARALKKRRSYGPGYEK